MPVFAPKEGPYNIHGYFQINAYATANILIRDYISAKACIMEFVKKEPYKIKSFVML